MDIGEVMKKSFIQLLGLFCSENIAFQESVCVTATLVFHVDKETTHQFDIEESFSRTSEQTDDTALKNKSSLTNTLLDDDHEILSEQPNQDEEAYSKNESDENEVAVECENEEDGDSTEVDDVGESNETSQGRSIRSKRRKEKEKKRKDIRLSRKSKRAKETSDQLEVTAEGKQDSKIGLAVSKSREVSKTAQREKKIDFSCPFCSTVFHDIASIQDHLKSRHNITDYSNCPFCKDDCSSIHQLLNHMQEKHNGFRTQRNERKNKRSQKVIDDKNSHVPKLRIKKKVKRYKKKINRDIYIDVDIESLEDSDEENVRNVSASKDKKTELSKSEVKCPKCDKIYCSKKGLRRHVVTVHENHRPKCDQCGKQFVGNESLKRHQRVHTDHKPYKCTEPGCDAAFKFNHSLLLHKLKHAGLRPYECKECKKTYLTSHHLKVHENAAHSVSKLFTCSVCGKSFPYSSSLKSHEATHVNKGRVHCDQCDKTFVHMQALKYHVKTRHTEPGCYPCTECKKVFKSEILLKTHLKRHTKEVRFMCDLCGNQFMYKSALESHRAIHRDEKTYECDICKKTFKTYPTLYSHKIVHSEASPYQCEQCGKSFKTKERCKSHAKRHSGLKPFECPICHHCFPDKGGLSKHTRTVHTDIRRFVCDICGKSTTRADNLRVHMKTHAKDDKQTIAVIKEEKSELSAMVPITVYGVVRSAKKKDKQDVKTDTANHDDQEKSINSDPKSVSHPPNHSYGITNKDVFLNLPTIDTSQGVSSVDNSSLPLDLQNNTNSRSYNLTHLTNAENMESTSVIPSVVESSESEIPNTAQPTSTATIVLPVNTITQLQSSPYVYAPWPYVYSGIPPLQNGSNGYFQG